MHAGKARIAFQPLLLRYRSHCDRPAATCPGSTVTLIASGGSAYTWNTGAVGDTINVEGPGTYTVIASDQCGSDQATIEIAQGTTLAPTFSVDVTEGCSPVCVVFNTVPAPNTTYTWLFADGTTAEGNAPEHCFGPGDHDVTLTSTEVDNANGCPGSITMSDLITLGRFRKPVFRHHKPQLRSKIRLFSSSMKVRTLLPGSGISERFRIVRAHYDHPHSHSIQLRATPLR